MGSPGNSSILLENRFAHLLAYGFYISEATLCSPNIKNGAQLFFDIVLVTLQFSQTHIRTKVTAK